MISPKTRVVLVHDWLTGMRGGEKVLEIFCRLFPSAPLYTLVHQPGSVSETIERRPIVTSGLDSLPGGRRNYRYFLPLMPWFIERMRLPPCDLVLSVSSCVAHGVTPPPGARSASYILSPMRYVYDQFDEYFQPGRSGLSTRLAVRLVRRPLQAWDRMANQRADSVVAISHFVADRIDKAYGRPAAVIAPPVDVHRFGEARSTPGDYYLMVTALAPYKNVDRAIEAFRGLNSRLVIAGSGPMLDRLRASCPANVELLGWVDDDSLTRLVAGCRAFLFPNVEDFGIAAVEAMAAGKPVLALGAGGALDTVVPLDVSQPKRPATGLFLESSTPESIRAGVARFEAASDRFDPASIRQWAQRFSEERFERQVKQWLAGVLPSENRRAPAPLFAPRRAVS